MSNRQPDPNDPTYLGDGVYASFDGYMIALHIHDHQNHPVVYLEPDVLQCLITYAQKHNLLPLDLSK